MTRRLIVIDQYNIDWLDRALTVDRGGEWHLLVLKVSEVVFMQRFGNELARLGYWRTVALGPQAPEAHRLVGEFVLPFIAQLPDQDLGGETLAHALGKYWWYLPITEKSPFRPPLVGQIYELALFHLVATEGSYDEIWLAVSDALLCNAIASGEGLPLLVKITDAPFKTTSPFVRYWLNAVRAFGAWLFMRMTLWMRGWRFDGALDDAFAILTFYPYWWTRPFGPNAAERFFAVPPDNANSFYLAWLTHPQEAWRRWHEAAATLRLKGIVPLQSFVRLGDALRILVSPKTLLFQRRYEMRLRWRLKARFLRFDVSDLIREEVSRSLSSSELVFCQLFEAAFSNFSRRVRARAVLCRVEFQPWESAVLFGMGGRAAVVGFYHAPFRLNHLPLRFAPGEMAAHLRGERGERDRPIPKAMLATGDVAADHLTDHGYPRGRIAVCGPQRHGALIDYLRRRIESRTETRRRLGLPENAPIFFVATGSVESENEAFFAVLSEACAEVGDFRLVVKTHPARPFGDSTLKSALDMVGRERTALMPPGGVLYDYLIAADALICIPSGMVFEALALEVMPVSFEDPATFVSNSLADFESAIYVVRDSDSMRAALEDVMTNNERAQAKRRVWPDTVARVFADVRTPLGAQLKRALDQLGV